MTIEQSDIIVGIDMAGAQSYAEEQVFGKLRDSYVEIGDLTKWSEFIDGCEDEWMRVNYGEDENAAHFVCIKVGKERRARNRDTYEKLISKGWVFDRMEWKKRGKKEDGTYYLPNPWTSARAVVKKAAQRGVDITSDMGKSEIQKKSNDLREKKPRDYNAEARALVGKLANIFPMCDNDVRSEVTFEIGKFL